MKIVCFGIGKDDERPTKTMSRIRKKKQKIYRLSFKKKTKLPDGRCAGNIEYHVSLKLFLICKIKLNSPKFDGQGFQRDKYFFLNVREDGHPSP